MALSLLKRKDDPAAVPSLRWFLVATLVAILGWRSLNPPVVVVAPQGGSSSSSSSSSSTPSSLRSESLPPVVPPLDLGVPPGSKLVINIGSNKDPIVPRPERDDACTLAIAFEPIIPDEIHSHPALHVVPAAVSDRAGWTTMNIYNKDGQSSSLGVPTTKAYWNQRNQGFKLVPLLDLPGILESLHSTTTNDGSGGGGGGGKYRIDFLKTDMQGFDFAAISAVDPEQWRDAYQVPHLMTEVYLEGVKTYVGARNDLCADWHPYMKKAGYVFEGLSKARPGYESAEALEATCREQPPSEEHNAHLDLLENDALWRHHTVAPTPKADIATTYFYPRHTPKKAGPVFPEADYRACREADQGN